MKHILRTLAIIEMGFLMFCASAYPVLAQTVITQTFVDQSFTSPYNLGANINECCTFVAQTFTAGLTGTLSGVSVDVFSPVSSPFPLHVSIHTVNADGSPSSMILSDTTLNSNSAPLSLFITFPQEISIVAGKQYAIVVSYQGAPPPGAGQFQGIWRGASGNLYTAGDLYSSVDGSSWFSYPGSDVHFQTYLTTPIFDTCVQDDSSASLLQLNSTTGNYQFTNGSGFTISGTGTLIKRGSIITLQDYASDRRVLARIDTSVSKATASVQIFSPSTTFTITDRNTANNTCVCTTQ